MIYHQDTQLTIHNGDALAVLQMMAAESVQCCVTSPPYYGLRDYGVDGQIGLEETPELFIARLVDVFREVRRVLKDDGVCFINIGDSYFGSACVGAQPKDTIGAESARKQKTRAMFCNACGCPFVGISSQRFCSDACGGRDNTPRSVKYGLKLKDLIGIPWMLAFALRADGWYLRSEIIWHKLNPMPESVTDRPTKAHEQIFLLSKSPKYFYDSEAVKEPCTEDMQRRAALGHTRGANGKLDQSRNDAPTLRGQQAKTIEVEGGRNRRSVWSIASAPYADAHFATYPPALIEPCILAGSRIGDTVLDPFGGSGTTAEVANKFGRKVVLIELNPEYCELEMKRNCQKTLFAGT